MKPFRFQLQPILSLKEQVEQTARVQQASVELTQCWTDLCQKLAGGVASGELLRARAWCNVLELRVKERAAALEQARHAVDAVWQELMRATRERESLDRLQERRRAAYNRSLQAAEQKQLDELALQMLQSPASVRAMVNPTAR
jgi:flagellar export protein FliJ